MLAVPSSRLAGVAVVMGEYDDAREPAERKVKSWPIPPVLKVPSRYAVSLVIAKRGAKPAPNEVVYAPALDVRLLTAVLILRWTVWFRMPATKCQLGPKSCLIRAEPMKVRR